MYSEITQKLSKNFKNFVINKIQSGASKKKIYRLSNNYKNYILIDFNNNRNDYRKYIRIYNILKDINISIPNIIENDDDNLFLICEDYGDLRFDKIYALFNQSYSG